MITTDRAILFLAWPKTDTKTSEIDLPTLYHRINMAPQEPAWMQRVHIPEGYPRPRTDAAPDAFFLALYFTGFCTFLTLFIYNTKRHHKFLFTELMCGFCVARTITTSLRLAWMYDITNRGLGIATTIFTTLGVLVMFIVNALLAQRLLRALHPHLGWHPWVWRSYLFLFLCVPCFLIITVTAIVESFFAVDPRILQIDLELEQAATVFFMFSSFLPIPIVLYGLWASRHREPDHFGKGSVYKKAIVLLISAFLLCVGATFRAGTIFLSFNPATQQNDWWNDKWSFYFFYFTVEIIVLVMYLTLRIDLMFHIPNGCKGPYSYTKAYQMQATPQKNEDVESLTLPAGSRDGTMPDSESEKQDEETV